MSIESLQIEIALTPRFKRDLRELNKPYRSIRTDLQPLIEQLQAGEVPGDQITGLEYRVFKVRLKNSNIKVFSKILGCR